MAGFIVDASATLPWCVADEATPWTEALLDRLRAGEEVYVPAHWPVEVMNALVTAVRHDWIDLARVLRGSPMISLASQSESIHPVPPKNGKE